MSQPTGTENEESEPETADGTERADGFESGERAERFDDTQPADADSDESGPAAPEADSEGDSTLSFERRERSVSQWGVWLLGGFFLVGLGLFYAQPALLLAAAVPFVYVGYASVSTLPSEVSLRFERELGAEYVTPGDPVEVTLSVTNTGDSVLTDLRVVDGVPDALAVTDGSPRGTAALRPGSTATVSYTVVAKRGDFAFGDARAVLRSLVGTDAASVTATVAGIESIDCTEPAGLPGLDRAAPLRVGQTRSDAGGEGLEFHATREYRSGDPRSRVNWRQYAKTGELVTTEFRQERVAREVVLLDVRPATRRSPSPSHPTAAEYAAYAAEVALMNYRSANHRVSLAVIGLSSGDVEAPVETVGDAVWVEDAGTEAGRQTAAAVFEAAAAVAADRTRPDLGITRGGDLGDSGEADPTTASVTRLVAAFPDGAELLVVSPLTDREPLAYARRARVSGAAVTLLSPDGTGDGTPGERLAGVHRRTRLREARAPCERVVDWPAERSLAAVSSVLAEPGGGR